MPKDLRILLLEDDDILSQVTVQMLEHLGCSVTTTGKGEDTVAAYKVALSEAPFTMVILDLTIGEGMGGAEAAAAILEMDPNANIIMSSGYVNDPTMTNYQTYGYKNVLKKPYQLDELTAILQTFENEPIEQEA